MIKGISKRRKGRWRVVLGIMVVREGKEREGTKWIGKEFVLRGIRVALDLRVFGRSTVVGPEPPVSGNQQSTYKPDVDTHGKINIHVSVVFVKSLSDLKKQRAQNRHISAAGSLDANGNGVPVSSVSTSDLNAGGFHRFTGNTSDIVAENNSDKSCCVVM